MNRTGHILLLCAAALSAGEAFCADNIKTTVRPRVSRPSAMISGLIAGEILREHAVTERILLVCEELARRLENREPVPDGALIQSVELVMRYVQDRQEKQEEKYIFPPARRTRKAPVFIKVLQDQHAAGRVLMENLARKLREPASPGDEALIAASLRSFIRMYRHHMSRENTILLPGFRAMFSDGDYSDLEAEFRAGESGREKAEEDGAALDAIELLEKTLGISDISQFTPR